MHIAAALGKPVASIFGPTNPVQVGPYGQPESVVRLDLPCSPCNYRRLSQCPHGHACMRDLPAEMVLAKTLELVPKGLLAARKTPGKHCARPCPLPIQPPRPPACPGCRFSPRLRRASSASCWASGRWSASLRSRR